ncbi:D-alanyl-lipoteichoic acid biosynthesis protein DltB [Bacillus xiamenensis]|uniref:Teichoic acid D-alanyltransferase n=1 Tax=Bacillus xiamenensis TaxID=1178537 RepID=A0AAC9IHJ8_9BACI|nr:MULTISPECIES: D-alanyl-lipoteichoic acid biosynthesis protein DltB [Bacillus]AOZ89810.1 D-alanyl-lipoteichoic acid biosynthesis protein DltB [Bacillus xiamenensis]MBG9910936.1 alanine transporter [Bacillus xiamenensis]MCY9575631.1 D-alanyl-lipoteichoic acid biosynthesis protein DltB [Bacillus xiamenensis]QGX65214.1 D-alanyl-lipoteichoic acid biosynthesis protein DltB [Bacillus sp. ms-22]
MIPFSSFFFFILIGILLLPTMILGLRGKRMQGYNMFATVVALALIFSKDAHGALLLFLFTVWQVLIIRLYIAYRLKANQASVFYMAVVASILPLVLSKILPFFLTHHPHHPPPMNWLSFLGISYLTFKGVQLIIETRDGLIKKKISIHRLVYFIVFFPTISSGPIDRYRRFEKDMDTPPEKEVYSDLLYAGIHKIFIGFLYKFIIGYLIHTYILMNIHYIGSSHFVQQLTYMYAYSMYLFFDFAGYTAFAVGVSYIMGIKSPENFNKPFLSRNIKDFWNRWHMSLSFWFRDYVFMRFVFFMTKKKWLKNRMAVSNIGYFVLFLLMGAWHGLALQYIIYGLYHAVVMSGYNLFEKWNKKHKWWPDNKVTAVVSIIITFHVICFGFYIFSGKPFHH